VIVVDAWLDTVPASLSVRDPQQARLALHPWKEIATATDAAVLLLCHTNRVATSNARDRYGATGELRKKARMTLFAQTDDNGNLVVGPEKMNTAAPIPASMFTIKPLRHFTPTDDHDGTVPLLRYLGESDQTAREHLVDNYLADHDTSGAEDAVAWLAEQLATGPQFAKEIFAAAKAKGISEKKVRTAKTRLNVEALRTDPRGPWFWALPAHKGKMPAVQMASDDPVSDIWESGNLKFNLRVSDDLSTSQDSQMTNGETQGHLGGAEDTTKNPILCQCGNELSSPEARARGTCRPCDRASKTSAVPK
jgi:hypothetical protein